MKIWDSILYEAPTREHYDQVMISVESELQHLRRQNRWFFWGQKLATGSVWSSVLMVILGLVSWSLRKKQTHVPQFETADLALLTEYELFENWDLIEQLDLLENWDGHTDVNEDL